MENAQDRVDFGHGALPIGGGQGKKSERVDTETRRSFDYRASSVGAGAVSCGTRQAAGGGPAPIAVGNDGNVDGAREVRRYRMRQREFWEWELR